MAARVFPDRNLFHPGLDRRTRVQERPEAAGCWNQGGQDRRTGGQEDRGTGGQDMWAHAKLLVVQVSSRLL